MIDPDRKNLDSLFSLKVCPDMGTNTVLLDLPNSAFSNKLEEAMRAEFSPPNPLFCFVLTVYRKCRKKLHLL